MKNLSKKNPRRGGPKFSKALKKLRLQSGLTQAQLANKIGVSTSSISKWEITPSIKEENLQKLAETFRVTIEDFHNQEPSPPRNLNPISKLRQLRLQTGLSQRQLANKINTVTSYISSLEVNPFANPNHETLQRIAQVLGKPVSEFWDDSWERKDLTEKQRVSLRAYKQFPKEDRLKLLEEFREFEEEDKRITNRDTKPQTSN